VNGDDRERVAAELCEHVRQELPKREAGKDPEKTRRRRRNVHRGAPKAAGRPVVKPPLTCAACDGGLQSVLAAGLE
jgi:hypothetical protein